MRQTEFFVILGHFLPFYHPHPSPYPNDPENQHFEKNEKNWFLIYKVQKTERSVILSHFLPFQASDNPCLENQDFKIEKKHPDILSFYTFTL